MEAFGDCNINMTQKLKFGLQRVEKGENGGKQPFILFPQYFQRVSLSDLLKIRIAC